MAPPARFVPHLMEELFDWMEREKEEVHPLILSCVFHYEFVFIHPFADGNGRMARLWHTCLLANWKPFFQYIPIESQIERFQEEYYNVIAQCHVNGDSNLFIEFMLRQIDQILKEVLLQSEGRSSVHRSYFDGVVGSKVKGIISQELSESGNRTSIDTDDSS